MMRTGFEVYVVSESGFICCGVVTHQFRHEICILYVDYI